MHLQEIKELDKAYYMNTFGARRDVAFDHGKGITLYDTDGNAYTDFFAGIAVNALGYGHPDFGRRFAKAGGQAFTYVESVLY